MQAVGEVVYREIPGFRGYRAGSDGTIWSCRRRGNLEGFRGGSHADCFGDTWHQVHGRVHVSGHREVRLSVGGGKKKLCKVHRLILLAFRGYPPPNKTDCRHLDGSPDNNKLDNLQWGSRQENINDSKRHGTFRFGGRPPHAPRGRKIVAYCLWRDGGISKSQISSRLNMHTVTIRKVIEECAA